MLLIDRQSAEQSRDLRGFVAESRQLARQAMLPCRGINRLPGVTDAKAPKFVLRALRSRSLASQCEAKPAASRMSVSPERPASPNFLPIDIRSMNPPMPAARPVVAGSPTLKSWATLLHCGTLFDRPLCGNKQRRRLKFRAGDFHMHLHIALSVDAFPPACAAGGAMSLATGQAFRQTQVGSAIAEDAPELVFVACAPHNLPSRS